MWINLSKACLARALEQMELNIVKLFVLNAVGQMPHIEVRHPVLNLASCHVHVGSKIVYLLNWMLLVLSCNFHPCVIPNPFITFLLNAERSVQKLLKKNVDPVAAVVIMACNRPDYLERTVESILKYGSRLKHLSSKSEMIYSTVDSKCLLTWY